mmetsp:Transcript_79042/g.232065  ORF Transcript_79042/g.232065 Transcript_79042/m.232065 type:complete len:245 (-) Transcript_79042:66-800(-)
MQMATAEKLLQGALRDVALSHELVQAFKALPCEEGTMELLPDLPGPEELLLGCGEGLAALRIDEARNFGVTNLACIGEAASLDVMESACLGEAPCLCDTAWESDPAADAKPSFKASKRLEVGDQLRICRGRDGKIVDAIITDFIGENIKVYYEVANRSYSEVVSTQKVGPWDNMKVEVGAPVIVRSAGFNAWFKGTVICCEDTIVKVHFRHNGKSRAKVLSKHSPDLRVCLRSVARVADLSAGN